jgi:hypothetical protein
MSDTQVNIGNFMDVQYTGSVFFGSEPEELTLVFDTGSDMMVVETDLCPSCIQPVFNTSESSTYTRVGYTSMSDLITMDYLSASLVGYNATDTISISSSAGVSVSNMPFMAVAVQTGFTKDFDGILGLSRQYVDTDGSFKHQPLFIEQAQKASVITNEIVAFSMSKTSTQSFADIGAINLAGVKDSDSSNIVYVPISSDIPYFWYSAKV